jgi:hypothetical protein
MDRLRFDCRLVIPAGTAGEGVSGTVCLQGDFGATGQSVLALAIRGKNP